MAGGRPRVLRVGELIDDLCIHVMDLRENTSCDTDLDCDAGDRRGRGARLMDNMRAPTCIFLIFVIDRKSVV